jgi:hypothetical protein
MAEGTTQQVFSEFARPGGKVSKALNPELKILNPEP